LEQRQWLTVVDAKMPAKGQYFKSVDDVGFGKKPCSNWMNEAN
jgi:hypothetical protein